MHYIDCMLNALLHALHVKCKKNINLVVSVTKPPKLIPNQIFQLYGIINLYKYVEHRVETGIDKS